MATWWSYARAVRMGHKEEDLGKAALGRDELLLGAHRLAQDGGGRAADVHGPRAAEQVLRWRVQSEIDCDPG